MNNFFKKSLLVTTLCTFFVVQAQETFILNYEDVDIKKVTQDIANFSKKTIILDPRVKGKVTIFSNSSLSSDEVWDVYLRTICLLYTSPSPRDTILSRMPSSA